MVFYPTQFLILAGYLLGLCFPGQAQHAALLPATPRTQGLQQMVPPAQPHKSASSATPAPNPNRTASITTRLISGVHHTYGYEVWADGHRLIAQPSIPGRPGIEGFRTAAEAQRVADLVVRKLRDNQMPPTITAAEHAGEGGGDEAAHAGVAGQRGAARREREAQPAE